MAIRRTCRASAVVVESDRVLLVGSKASPRAWVPPGGKVEPRERARETAAREVREETGLGVAPGRLLAYRELWWPDHDALELYFAAQVVNVKAARDAVTGDHPWRWVALTDLAEIPHFPEELEELCALAQSASDRVMELQTCDLRNRQR